MRSAVAALRRGLSAFAALGRDKDACSVRRFWQSSLSV